MALLGGCLGGFAILPTVAHAARNGDKAEVAANGDLTVAGKKFSRPTPDQPAYYVPVIRGWHEEGALTAGEEPPKRADLLRHVGQALAKENYVLQALRPDANTTLPSLIITVEWGYLNPVVSLASAQPPLNQGQMFALVAGSALQRQAFFSESDWQKLNNAVAEDRYYLIVSALDFAASLKGEQVLLWRTRMSTPRQGVWMQDIVPALVTAGTPLFGRQSDVPTWQDFKVREGRVEMGDIKVIDADVRLPAEAAKDEKSK